MNIYKYLEYLHNGAIVSSLVFLFTTSNNWTNGANCLLKSAVIKHTKKVQL